MNKRTKIMLVLLSAATMTAGVLGLTGCGEKNADAKTEDVYATYVAYAEEHGQEPMTYEQWLATIKGDVFIKGDKGDTGAPGTPGQPGAPGEPGEPGANGKGVDEIKISDDGKSLEISYSDGSKENIKLPDQITHVHQYDDEVIVLIPVSAEEDRDGLGYKVCTENGCQHIELVVINKYYNITVTVDGQPEAGVDVIINGARATTNENGLAKVQGFGNYNDYIITVDSEGYTTDRVYRTEDGATQTVALNRAMVQAGSAGNRYYVFPTQGNYSLTVKLNSDGDRVPIEARIINDSTSAKKYRLSLADPAAGGDITDNADNSVVSDGKYEVTLDAGEEARIKFSIEYQYWWDNMADPSSTLTYAVKFQELDPPAAGTSELPAKVTYGVQNALLTSVADADGWVYYQYFNIGNEIKQISFDLTDVEAEITLKEYVSWKFRDKAEATAVTSGSALTLMTGSNSTCGEAIGSYKFRVKATGANPSFKLNLVAAEGNKFNPKAITLGANSISVTDSTEQWFTFTAPSESFYTLETINCGAIDIYNGMPADNTTGAAASLSGNAQKSVVKIAAGEHYVKVTPWSTAGVYACEFTFSAYNEATDLGYSEEKAKPLTVDFASQDGGSKTATISSVAAKMGIYTYYTFTMPETGTLSIAGAAKFSAYLVVNGGQVASNKYNSGDTVTVKIRNRSADGSTTATLTLVPETVTEPVAIEHTFNIRDYSDDTSFSNCAPVQGVTVTIKNPKDNSVVATSDATGADGVAKVSFVPGAYTVELSGYSATDYSFEGKTTDADSTSYNINLNNVKKDFNITVESGATKFEGATVKIMKGTTVVASQTTNEQGVAAFTNIFIPMTGELKYTVELASADAENYALTPAKLSAMTINKKTSTEIKVEFGELVEYSVKVANANGGGVQGISVVFNDGKNDVATGTTGIDGVAKLKTVGGMYYLRFADVPAGHNVSCTDSMVNASNLSYEATYNDGDYAATGCTDPNDAIEGAPWGDGVLGAGINVLTNNDAVNYYTLGNVSGRYSIKVEDKENKGYISYLAIYDSSTPTVLINDGKQASVAGDIVLGAIRGRNKCYEVELDLSLREINYLVVGYNTGTESGGKANLVIEQAAPSSEYDLQEGANSVTLVNGSATLYYTLAANSNMTLSWETPNVTVVANAIGMEPLNVTSGEAIEGGRGDIEFTFTVTSSSATTVSFTLATEQA